MRFFRDIVPKYWNRPRLFGLAMLAVLLAGNQAVGATYVSTDICADQIAVMLLKPEEIAGLSRWARTGTISAVAIQAETLPMLAPSAEAVLLSGADVVLAGSFGDRFSERLLQRLGIPIIRIPAANDFTDMFAILKQSAHQLDREAEGEDKAQILALRLAQAEERARKQSQPLALYLRPDGGGAGRETPVDQAFRAANFRNQAALGGQIGWGGVALETIILDPPEVVVTSFFDAPNRARSGSYGRHPALMKTLKNIPIITIPGGLWSCAGWPLVDAVETLVEQKDGILLRD